MGGAPVFFGIREMLCNVFPEDKKFGGALLNFSRHCDLLGASAHPVGAVGVDTDGEGNSFTATLCMSLLESLPLAEINRHAKSFVDESRQNSL